METFFVNADGGGIAEVELSGADSKQNCLSDDVILSLAKTGLQVC